MARLILIALMAISPLALAGFSDDDVTATAKAGAVAGSSSGAMAEGGTGYGGDGGQAFSGPSTSSADGGMGVAQNGDQSLTNVYQNHYRYQAPFIDSPTFLMNSAPCKTYLGLQFSAADADGAGGTGLGLPFDDKDCKLDKAARLAFASGNTKLGWELFCSSPALIGARADVLKLQGVTNRKARRLQAYQGCMAGAIDWKATLDSVQIEIEELTALLIEVAERPGFDDSAIRARLDLLESAAHRPRSVELIVPAHEE